MQGFDAHEHLTPFRDARGYGAVLFDRSQLRQPDPAWFDPQHWGDAAERVRSGGRGGAWFIRLGQDEALLRHYLRGGMMANLSHDGHLWRGAHRVRSFHEYRLLRALRHAGLPVPMPYAAWYRRRGLTYQAAILMQRLQAVRSLGERLRDEDAPWGAAGELIARFHRQGLDHADLNAHNLLFDDAGRGWMIDFDRARMRIPADDWRTRNLARLQRSLRKIAGPGGQGRADAGFAQLQAAYDDAWARGT